MGEAGRRGASRGLPRPRAWPGRKDPTAESEPADADGFVVFAESLAWEELQEVQDVGHRCTTPLDDARPFLDAVMLGDLLWLGRARRSVNEGQVGGVGHQPGDADSEAVPVPLSAGGTSRSQPGRRSTAGRRWARGRVATCCFEPTGGLNRL